MADTGLTQQQLELLLSPLHPSRVRHLNNQSHLEAWDVRRWLTRIFGFAGWSDEILSCELVHEQYWPVVDKGQPVPGKNRCTAVYRVTLRLTVKDVHGNVLGYWDDAATGDAVNQASVGDAHDLALKTAVSQALKRCAVNLGDQFGLSLYNKGKTGAVVGRTVAMAAPGADGPIEDAPVEGGELDEAREQPQLQRLNGASPQNDQWATPDPTPIPPRAQGAEAARPSTSGQRTKLVLLVKDKRGITDDAQRHMVAEQLLGREVTSFRDLTLTEASKLIETLSGEPDYAPSPGPPEGWSAEQADHLAADFLAGLQGARTDPERVQIAGRIAQAVKAHKISPEDRDTLLAAYRQPAGAPA